MFQIADELLIELVRQHECLFNLSHKDYNDCIIKMKLWKKIGEEMGVTAAECKQRWFSLRDQYRRSLRNKVKCGSGQTVLKRRAWKYEKEMTFLLPHFQERDSLTNVPEVITCEAVLEGSQESTSDEHMEMQDPLDHSFNNNSRKWKIADQTASGTLMQYLLQSKENPHPVDSFLKGIASTIKSFSPMDQHIAKDQIFKIVSEMELNSLTKQQSSIAATSSASENYISD